MSKLHVCSTLGGGEENGRKTKITLSKPKQIVLGLAVTKARRKKAIECSDTIFRRRDGIGLSHDALTIPQSTI